MLAVVTPEVNAGMWLSATHFAVDSTNSWPVRPIFQTVRLVMPGGFEAHGR